MCRVLLLAVILFFFTFVSSEQWPYNRYSHHHLASGELLADKNKPEFDIGPENLFIHWLRGVVKKDTTGELQKAFVHGHIPKHVTRISELEDHLRVPSNVSQPPPRVPLGVGPVLPGDSHHAAARLFAHLGFPLDTRCTLDRTKWWYRTYDGSCNWLEKDHINEGAVGSAKVRDYNQHYYADGISKPRQGPNARAVSNAFFKRKKALYYEHTPLLLGLIEFIMHDVTYSQDSDSEFIEVPMPEDEQDFYKNTTLQVWRTAAVPGTGLSKDNPRENVNMATTWLDISSLYGSTPEVAMKLRSFKTGKLLTQEVVARGTRSKGSYLPFNSMGVPTRTRPGVDPEKLFAGGDPRTNEDWMMLGVHTLMVREHNRLCNILAKQHPEYDDEQLYQTVRLIMSAKYSLIANAYQMAYWTDKMPWPRDDGFPLYRQMYGESALDISPANTYPWPLVTKDNKPMVVSVEMAVVYRFHEFIISSFPIKDAGNNTLWEQDLFSTGFNATGFIDTGLENVLRGMVASNIPNFKSGVDEKFRTAGVYRGKPFDIATWSIIHEREQGLPTFNNYFREYNKGNPKIEVPIRRKFRDFSTDPEMVSNLKRLYKKPDDVDLVVGIQLDEEMFPGTTVPKSALIISLFSLFGMGNSDRFSVGYAMMRCLLVDKPWDCHPSNALEELLWKPKEKEGFPDYRVYDRFWLKELDLPAHGTNLLWRLITENSDIKCVQHRPLFPVDPVTNPVLCALPKTKLDYPELVLTGVEVAKKYLEIEKRQLATLAIVLILTLLFLRRERNRRKAPVLHGWPIIGEALSFQNDSLALLQKGFAKYGPSSSSLFGIKLGSLTHYVLTQREDLLMMTADGPYEVKFNLHSLLKASNIPVIVRKDNFASELHTKLVRTCLGDANSVASLRAVIEDAANMFLAENPVAEGNATARFQEGLDDYLSRYLVYVVSRSIVGPMGADNPQILDAFLDFNKNAAKAMRMSMLLPNFLQIFAAIGVDRHFRTLRKMLVPIIEQKRVEIEDRARSPVLLDHILGAVEDDKRASDLVVVINWMAFTKLQSAFSSTVLDIINQPDLQSAIVTSLKSATSSNLNASGPSLDWAVLRSSMLESLRLCGSTIGPGRRCTGRTPLKSNPTFSIPRGEVATLSAYITHRQKWAWGDNAEDFDYQRFLNKDPPVGEPEYIVWGLKGPHMCPAKEFAQVTILIMTKALLNKYKFTQERILTADERYIYNAGDVTRRRVCIEVIER